MWREKAPEGKLDLLSVLLAKIAKEKKRLIKEGKIKKQKKLREISEDERPFDLPESWEWTRLGDITNYGISDKAEPGSVDEDTWVLELEDVEKETSKLLQKVRFFDRQFKSSKNLFFERDVIYGKLRPYLDKVIVADESGVCTTEMIPLRGYCNITPQYLRLVMKSPYFIRYANESTHGMNLPRMGTDKARLALFPMVSEAEQHRIVAKVDELMALCDRLEHQQTDSNAAHQTLVETLLTTLTDSADQAEFAKAWQRIANHFDTLFTTEQSIDQLKQTILQLAVMGKLVPQEPADLPGAQPGKFFVYALECEDKSIYIGQTDDILKNWKKHATGEGADWTKKHPPLRLVHWEEYNSREEAIKREKELKTGFGRKWIKRELAAGRTRQAGEPVSVLLERIAKEKARLIKEGKIKKQKPLPEIGEDEKPFESPECWEWARIGDASLFTEYGMSEKTFDGINGIPVFKMGDIQDGKVILGGQKLVPENVEGLPSLYLKNGDVLYNRTNSAELVGKTGIYDGPDDAYTFASYLVRIRCSKECVHPTYLNLSMNTPLFRFTQIDPHLKQQCGQANVNATIMKNMIVSVPPIHEQHRIVAKVDELMVLCETLKARLNDAQTTQVQLADAIVEQAVA